MTIRYHEAGAGAPIVFVHGALANANLWRKVVPELTPDFRCITLDLPFGAHDYAVPRQLDLAPPGVANMVADAFEALSLENVTLVGNDAGGVVCQLVATRRSERLGRLVLTSTPAFENFPARRARPLVPLAQIPGAILLAFAPLAVHKLRRLPPLGWVAKYPIDRDAADTYVLPAVVSADVRRDVKKVARGLDNRYTKEAAERLRTFDRPTLLAWSKEDRVFPREQAERLAATLPNATLEWIDDAWAYSPEDQPKQVADLIAAFVREPAHAHAA